MRTIRPARRNAFLLNEALIAIAVGGVAVVIGTKLLVDAIYLHYLAAGHDRRQIVQDALTEHLRADLMAAAEFAWREDGAGATLLLFAGGEPDEEVSYRVEPERLTRRSSMGPEAVWSAERLQFRAEAPPSAALLRIAFVEMPPARATALPNRTLERTFRLPRARTAATEPEAGP